LQSSRRLIASRQPSREIVPVVGNQLRVSPFRVGRLRLVGGRGDYRGGASRMPILVKYAVLGVGSVLWLFGLADQLHSFDTAATYLAISALMVVIAVL